MTRPDDGHEVGRLLVAVVPPLTTPPDRLAAVHGRARRGRARVAVLAAGSVALMVIGGTFVLANDDPRPATVTSLSTATARVPADPSRQPAATASPRPVLPDPPPIAGLMGPQQGACPDSGPTGFSNTNGGHQVTAPGDLAPPGAVRVLMCRYGSLPEYNVVRPGPARELVLTTRVAEMQDLLNQLPVEQGVDPCFSRGGGGVSMTLVYVDGATATIEFGGCGYVRRGDITRHGGAAAPSEFERLYRAQELAAAQPADTMPAADCAASLMPGAEPYFAKPDPVFDRWLTVSQRGGRTYLPAPLAAVTACRYVDDGRKGMRRVQRITNRSLVGPLTTAVEEAYDKESGHVPFLDCQRADRPRTLDVLMLRDVIGEVAEVRILRDSCEVVTFGFDAASQTPALLALLDQLLGEP